MNIPIIARDFMDLGKALAAMGYENIKEIIWNRPPMKINGLWRAEVHHEARKFTPTVAKGDKRRVHGIN